VRVVQFGKLLNRRFYLIALVDLASPCSFDRPVLADHKSFNSSV
jgi:hypothetical protein